MSMEIVNKTFTCIVCPRGCTVTAACRGDEITAVTGNTCAKGEAYVRQELTAPQRTIATSVRVTGGQAPLCSVRTAQPVLKARIFDVIRAIHSVTLQAPVQQGEVVLENVLGLSSNVIATKDVDAIK